MLVAWGAAVMSTAVPFHETTMMIRLIVTGACALFLVGCGAKTETPSTGNTPAATATTDTKAVFELGQDV